MTRQRYVVHLPVCAASLDSATLLARNLARSLTFLPAVDAAEITVSEEDHQGVRHRVFCDRLLDGRRRCALRTDHPGERVPESAR
ncbi:hypothetical protein [Micromonospora sp. NPDC049679]|uniref:hypothetical protein n=1 Tax=Micromonospora sp. NPDC049679 TaxID=3155920 RepID=UPI0033CE00D5